MYSTIVIVLLFVVLYLSLRLRAINNELIETIDQRFELEQTLFLNNLGKWVGQGQSCRFVLNKLYDRMLQ